MENLKLFNRIEITKILKKTRDKLFKDIEVGDVLLLRIPLERIERNGKSLYSTDVEILNLDRHDRTEKSITELTNLLSNFEYWTICDADEYVK